MSRMLNTGLLVCLWMLVAVNALAQSYYVPDTGDPNERFCNPHSYTDLGNGIVRDNVTGLEWVQDGNLMASRDPSFDNDGTAGDGRVMWQHALDYIDLLNADSYLSYNDWRLPTIEELSTIIDSGRANPSIDPIFNALLPYYWSSSVYVDDTSYAWLVSLDIVRPLETDTLGYVRAVRGDLYSSPDNFVINGNGTVTDNNTGLIWQRCNYGQLWDGTECTGSPATRTWQEALEYVRGLNGSNYLGHSDWRLPSRNELQSLIDYSIYGPATSFPDMRTVYYWSSTSRADSNDSKFSVYFYFGTVAAHNKSKDNYVRAVRGGSCWSDYVVCTIDSDCGAGLLCRAETGDCVECLNDIDCADNEVCNVEAGNCVECFVDEDCDDSVMCNGEEFCAGGLCLAGTSTCAEGEYCNETTDTCEEINQWTYEEIDPNCSIFAMWGASEADMYVGGTDTVNSNSCFYHYDGTQWDSVSLPGLLGVTDIWGSSGDDVYVVGAIGWCHYDGENWTKLGTEMTWSVWGFAPDDVFMGTYGIERYEGTAWGSMLLPTDFGSAYLSGLWGSSAADMYAVGNQSTVMHYDGNLDGQWEWLTTGLEGTYYDLFAVWASSPDDVFASGENLILHYDGSQWSQEDIPHIPANDKGQYIYKIYGTAFDDVYAVVSSGHVLHYDGTAWSFLQNPVMDGVFQLLVLEGGSSVPAAELPDTLLRTMHVASAESIYFAGDNGIVIHYTPDTAKACVSDADCDNGLFCDGAEVCDVGVCISGNDLCLGGQCDEINDQCVECLEDSHCAARHTCEGSLCVPYPVTSDEAFVSLKGSGTVDVIYDPNGKDIARIVVTGAADDTSLSIKSNAKKTLMHVDEIILDGTLKAFKGKNIVLDGTLTATGGIEKLQLAGTGGESRIEAAWIGKLSVAGDFAGDMSLTGAGSPPKNLTLGKALVKGALAGATWLVNGNAGSVKVGTWDAGSTLAVGVEAGDDSVFFTDDDVPTGGQLGKFKYKEYVTDNDGDPFGIIAQEFLKLKIELPFVDGDFQIR